MLLNDGSIVPTPSHLKLGLDKPEAAQKGTEVEGPRKNGFCCGSTNGFNTSLIHAHDPFGPSKQTTLQFDFRCVFDP